MKFIKERVAASKRHLDNKFINESEWASAVEIFLIFYFEAEWFLLIFEGMI